MTMLADPLREARRAVHSGRFQNAAGLLDSADAAARDGAEWQLLSAMTAWRLGRFAPSRAAAVAARNAYRTAGDADGEMRSENVAAAGAFALGDLEEAERGFSRALLLARRLGDGLLGARGANNLGNVAFYLARHDEAMSYYRLANAEFERLAFPHGLAETWINLGFVSRDLKDMRGALDAAERALDAAERAGQPRLVAQALVSRGEAQAALGDAALGRAQVERGLAMARAEADRLAEAEALRVLSGIARDAGDLAGAERLGRDALAVATAMNHPWTIAEVQRDLGGVYAAGNRAAEASGAYGAAADHFLRLGSVPRAERMQAMAEQWRSRNLGA